MVTFRVGVAVFTDDSNRIRLAGLGSDSCDLGGDSKSEHELDNKDRFVLREDVVFKGSFSLFIPGTAETLVPCADLIISSELVLLFLVGVAVLRLGVAVFLGVADFLVGVAVFLGVADFLVGVAVFLGVADFLVGVVVFLGVVVFFGVADFFVSCFGADVIVGVRFCFFLRGDGEAGNRVGLGRDESSVWLRSCSDL